MAYDGQTPIIQMENIVKTFPGVKALDNMSLDLYEGEIHCLVGENGAGKSTLIKVLSGAYKPDSGSITVGGNVYDYMTAQASSELGIGTIYQENLLVPWMNVVENIFVGRELSRYGKLDLRGEYKRTQELCQALEINLELNKLIADLSVSDQQFVKILKALNTNPKVLIMDEPTSMFNSEDADKVLNLVTQIANQGVSIIYISHFLKEVKQIADRITVIRDGASISTYDNADKDVDLDKIVSDMVGRDATMFYEKDGNLVGGKSLEIVDLKVEPDSEPISFHANRGEILGIAGMVGSGRTEIANAIFGATRKFGGEIIYNGEKININDPYDSVINRIAYITEDRQRLGLNLRAPIIENLTHVGLQTKIKGFYVNVKDFISMCSNLISGLKIKMVSPMQEVRNLSGGNQQKVVLGKWLFTESNVFIFDEPTRGIDVNAKFEFYKIINEIARQGKVIVLISSDMPELISMSDRILVIVKGRIVKTLERDDISEESIIRYALEVQSDEFENQ